MKEFIDLTGNRYGKLTVIKRVENRGYDAYWLCRCDCKNEKEIRGANLKNSHTTTCGKCPINTWEFKDDYIIGYTRKGEKFYIDIEDYDEVSKYTWCLDRYGYVVSGNVKGKNIKLHRFIMKLEDNETIDHIKQRLFDNRKSELRICTNQENLMNRKNVNGYKWDEQRNKYQAKIMINYKSIHIGSYDTEEEARLAYCTKAIELFGEFVHEDVVKDYETLSKKFANT